MISAVRSALDGILGVAPSLRWAAGAGRLFELFVLAGIAVRLQNRGLDVWLQRSDGSRIYPTDQERRFIQRSGAPTGVAPASAGRTNASVIGFMSAGGSIWEIWNGIQFQGRSGATHEIDIAIVPGEIGTQLRTTGGLPFGRPRVAIECKDVGQPGGVDEMRALVARLYDLTLLQSHHRYLPFAPPAQAIYPGNLAGSPSFHAARVTYWEENRHTMNVIARRSGFAVGAVAMTSYYAIEPHGRIRAGSTEANVLMDGVATWIVARCP